MKQAHSQDIKASVKNAYSAIAKDFDRTRQHSWKEFEGFLNHVKNGDHVLDVGCGNGRLFGFFQEKGLEINYLGVDHNPELLSIAKKNFPEAHFQEGELENPGTKEGQFDVLFCIAAFHHLPDRKSRKKAVKAMHQTLKLQGKVILTVWNLWQKKYWKEWIRATFHHLITFGKRLKWNDLWIKWGKAPLKRYYHSFFPKELQSYFPESDWVIEELYFTRKGKRMTFKGSFNMVLVVRKKFE